MELITADKDTVTIKMDVQKEFLPILGVFLAASQGYDELDREIHDLTKDQIQTLQSALAMIARKLSA